MNGDLIIGVNADKFNQALNNLFGNQAICQAVFKGSQQNSFEGVAVNVNWELKAPPAIDFRSPTPEEWKISIKDSGAAAIPVQNAFILTMPSLSVGMDSAGSNRQSTIPLLAICTAGNNGTQVLLSANAIIIDVSALSAIDKFIVTMLLVPQILKAVNQTLGGLKIPTLSFMGVNLTPPSVGIIGNKLVIACNLTQHQQPDLNGAVLPAQPFFVLASQDLVLSAANAAATTHIQGQTFNKDGSESSNGFGAEYHVNGVVNNISVRPTGDPLTYRASVSVSLNAQAGINLPIVGYIIQGGQVIYEGLQQAGQGIIDVGKKLDPTSW